MERHRKSYVMNIAELSRRGEGVGAQKLLTREKKIARGQQMGQLVSAFHARQKSI